MIQRAASTGGACRRETERGREGERHGVRERERRFREQGGMRREMTKQEREERVLVCTRVCACVRVCGEGD